MSYSRSVLFQFQYTIVAQKSVLKRAISKPVLEKRGLVSCLDYYLERHALKVS